MEQDSLYLKWNDRLSGENTIFSGEINPREEIFL